MFILTRHSLDIRTKLERLLPAQPCLLCGAMSRHGVWCTACDAGLPYLAASRCPVCALPTLGGATCGQCLKKRPLFDRTVAVFSYAFPLDRLVMLLKFNEQLQLASSFAEKIAVRVDTLPDCVVPMPLHPERLKQRGFNQSAEVASRVARRLGVAFLAHACQRVRDTPPQSALKWKQRSKNVRRAFSCTQDMREKHVAIVDDVMTSGASINELALSLRRAGARDVSALVVARTLPHSRHDQGNAP